MIGNTNNTGQNSFTFDDLTRRCFSADELIELFSWNTFNASINQDDKNSLYWGELQEENA